MLTEGVEKEDFSLTKVTVDVTSSGGLGWCGKKSPDAPDVPPSSVGPPRSSVVPESVLVAVMFAAVPIFGVPEPGLALSWNVESNFLRLEEGLIVNAVRELARSADDTGVWSSSSPLPIYCLRQVRV